MDYGSLPDLAAVALLICAFASVAKHHEHPGSGLWLSGWSVIALHFAATIFTGLPGILGLLFNWICAAALTWAAVLFMSAMVPYRHEPTRLWMSTSMLVASTLYLALLIFLPSSPLLGPATFLFGVPPLAIALSTLPRFQSSLRWTVVSMQSILTVFLLFTQHRPDGIDLAINAILFTYYLNCTLHFCLFNKKLTTGTFVTIAGFFSWAMVFVLGPLQHAYFPSLHIESEVWNLPKYVVAASMILLMLERQIDYNKYLALHDELTGLPNRRLFQDRLNNAIERSRRCQQQMAMLLIDLDYFKQVNDTMGHHMGDLLLRHVGEVFLGRLRRSDTLARTGGDEFSILLEENISLDGAQQVSDALRQLLAQPILLDGQIVRSGASIGIAMYPEDARTGEDLCILADRKMYDSKRQTHLLREQSESAGNVLNPGPTATAFDR
ncbi:diguanylate cyclase domain-containing protein [Telmatobacter bradus]|uniref:diguanylate cyclase domain-containing protein n=1 Tax=Telmatobacter bradus TaxID=474953 RepID=UPI003B42FCC2